MTAPGPGLLDRPERLRLLMLETKAARIVEAMRGAGVDSLLLKGPSTNRWLWADPMGRRYRDIDVLVGPRDWAQACSTLERLGFVNRSAGLAPAERTPHEDQLVDSDGTCVDLHRTLVGVRADEDTLWSALTAHRESMLLRGTEVQVLDETARCLHAALHAAAGGPRDAGAIEVLRRAAVQADASTWAAAARLACAVDALAGMAAGLRLDVGGALVAEMLELPTDAGLETRLRASAAPHGSRRLHALTVGDARYRAAVLHRELYPSRNRLEERYPGRTGSPAELARTRALHVVRTLRLLPPAVRGLLAARSAGRSGDAPSTPAGTQVPQSNAVPRRAATRRRSWR